jgi:hypothetical protein
LELERWAGGHAHALAAVDVSSDHDRGAGLVDGDVLNWTQSTQASAQAMAGTSIAPRGREEADLELRL